MFNLVMEYAARKVTLNSGTNIYNRLFQHLAYADDLCMIARRFSSLTIAFEEFQDAAKGIGLQLNQDKTKYISSNPESRDLEGEVQIGEYKIEKVKAFKYLGSVVTSDNNVNTEIKSRLVAGNKVYFALQNLLKNKNILRKVKLNIYDTYQTGSSLW